MIGFCVGFKSLSKNHTCVLTVLTSGSPRLSIMSRKVPFKEMNILSPFVLLACFASQLIPNLLKER